jgi:putative toxin-antitoxin system antitoxin component (TIGR02293 family)
VTANYKAFIMSSYPENLLQKGIELFGSETAFLNWLSKPAYGLHDQVPETLLTTEVGRQAIFEELDRIEHGDLA